jgi:DNA-binding MarR family transcriptional regulator
MLDMNITIQAQTLKKALEESFGSIRKKYNLTMNEVIVLLYLIKNDKKDTAKDIVEDIMITKSHISKSVDSLVNKNIITRIPDNIDKKIVHLQIIDKTSQLVKDITKTNRQINKKITKGITDEELYTLEKVFIKIKDNIKKI